MMLLLVVGVTQMVPPQPIGALFDDASPCYGSDMTSHTHFTKEVSKRSGWSSQNRCQKAEHQHLRFM